MERSKLEETARAVAAAAFTRWESEVTEVAAAGIGYWAQGKRLRTGFERLARKYGVIGDIRGKGLLQGIEFVRDLKTKEPFAAKTAFGVRVGRRALAHGLLCRFD